MTERTPEQEIQRALSAALARQRWFLGWLGLWLPTVILLWGWVAPEQVIPESISASYYLPNRGSFFIGALCAIGVFLVNYEGHPPGRDAWHLPFLDTRVGQWLDRVLTDSRVTTLAGWAALGTALLPTSDTSGTCGDYVCSTAGHAVLAGTFLALLAYMAVFQFTRSDKRREDWSAEKRLTNRLYLVCGSVMGLAVVLLAVRKAMLYFELSDWTWPHPPVFWLEAFGVWAFGLAWLVKSDAGLGAAARKAATKFGKSST